jgi:hypothetical protein
MDDKSCRMLLDYNESRNFNFNNLFLAEEWVQLLSQIVNHYPDEDAGCINRV